MKLVIAFFLLVHICDKLNCERGKYCNTWVCQNGQLYIIVVGKIVWHALKYSINTTKK